MSIRYESLDEETRHHMEQELDLDVRLGRLYLSPRLGVEGRAGWAELLREALVHHDDAWLAETLSGRGYLRSQERRKASGQETLAGVASTAADTLAEGEFNRYYLRGLCRQVLASGGSEVEIYRGKEVSNPRPESEALLGRRLPAQALLEDLRASLGVEPALGLPPGPNSGLTARRVTQSP